MAAPTTKERSITLPAAMTVKDLGDALGISPIDVIKRLMTHGVMAALNQTIDFTTAAVIADEVGIEALEAETARPAVAALEHEIVDEAGDLKPRPPVVTILGHVDHGKTSLLDAIRQTKVAAGEAGGITQHIGAYQIERNGQPITFIDTPGHAAFTAMRARGAQVTDIAVLVVAADDGVMPQTQEAIGHALAAGVPLIVAINKIDLPGSNPDRVKQQLTEHNVIVEDFGGDVLAIPVSAIKREGLEELLDAIALVAEVAELKANPSRKADAVVVEAELDPARGPIATLLVKGGTLHQGDAVVAGEISGKVKAMFDDAGKRIKTAGPSTPVVVMGLESVPAAGERVLAVDDEKTARAVVDERKREREAAEQNRGRLALDTLFHEISAGNIKELVIVLKTDVRGSAEAIKGALEQLNSEEVKVKVIYTATGPVNDSDVMLAEAAGGIVLAFNTRVEPTARRQGENSGVEIRSYTIIYQLIDDVQRALRGLHDPVYKEVQDGHAEVRQVFKSSRVGQIAGSFVLDGTLRRNASVRVMRGGREIAKVRCDGLKRFKDDVREVQAGYECGITLAGFDDFEEGDILEFFHDEKQAQV
ncbi:MAG: translation initiation factor IF-2 [Dehalococcoidia bacterium]|nr:translation initiation factor IF-2 [Dehalococcoidia bacterium]